MYAAAAAKSLQTQLLLFFFLNLFILYCDFILYYFV